MLPPGISSPRFRQIRRGVLFLWLWSRLLWPALAAEPTAHAFDLPAGDATETLKRFGVQAKREIMFPAEAVAGVKTNAIKGAYTVREALDRMIVSTGLTVTEDDQTGALMIFRASSPKPPGAAPPDKKPPTTPPPKENT